MPGFSNFKFDTLSFWLGFLAATLFWWLARKLRPAIPRALERVRGQMRQARRKSSYRLDDGLRKDMLRRAQAMHLAAPLFALDEVLVEPGLVAPPPALVSPGQASPNTIANQVIPYLPEWPELSAAYPVRLLSAAEALQNGARIAVIGQPGSGKTTILAALASQMARRASLPGGLQEKTPLLFHAAELTLDGEEWKADPLLPLIKTTSGQSPVLTQPQIPRYLRAAAVEGRLLLLMDGLDETHPQDVSRISAWLGAVLNSFPGLGVIAACAPDGLDGLGALGFVPLAVAAWNAQKREQFFTAWAAAWQKLAQTTPAGPAVDSRILNLWLASETELCSPLEWTLKAWALYAGDIRGATALEALEAHARRGLGRVPPAAVAQLGALMVAQAKPALRFGEMERTLADVKTPPGPPKPATEKKLPFGSKNKEAPRSSGAQMIDTLIESGMLVRHGSDLLRFASPVLCGYFAAQCMEEGDAILLAQKPGWAQQNETARFAARGEQGAELAQAVLTNDSAPLHAGLLAVARWLRDVPAATPWRAQVLRRMVTLIQQDDLSLGMRARVMAAFLAGGDSSLPLLVKQLMALRNPAVRQVAALGAGALQSGKLLNDVLGLLADSAPDVRYSACLALGAYASTNAGEALNAALLQGDEGIQQAAAEVLANQGGLGHEALKAALASDNLMARRAAVLGLANIPASWAASLLEKTAVEDAQWVVRSAAAQAVEGREQGDPYPPRPLPAAANAPWLITFASKQGVGVPAEGLPLELLLNALQNGSKEDRLAALSYLRGLDDERLLERIYALLDSGDTALAEAALYTLWHKAACGQSVSRVSFYRASYT